MSTHATGRKGKINPELEHLQVRNQRNTRRAKLTIADAHVIRNSTKLSATKLAELFGVSTSTVRAIKRGEYRSAKLIEGSEPEPIPEPEFELVQILPIWSVYPSPENDKVYNPSDVTDLAEDIKKHGQLEPIVITRDHYILSGHRRHAACRKIELTEIKCRFENIFRSDSGFILRLTAYNQQRIKTVDEILREEVIVADPEESHRALVAHRRKQISGIWDEDCIELRGFKGRARISKAKYPFLEAIIDVLNSRRTQWPLSVRQVHYALLNNPPLTHASKPNSVYQNNLKYYGQTSELIARARLTGSIPWSAIDDETRPIVEGWGYPNTKPFIKSKLDGFLKDYCRDYQQSQPNHIEIVGEKNTIHTIVRRVASHFCIPYTIGRGYCSLSPRKKLVDRFRESKKDQLVLLVLSDFDPDGEEIGHSFARSLRDDFGIGNIKPIKVALTRDQIDELGLPPLMKAKESSSNYERFAHQHGNDAYELEAVEPETLQRILVSAIDGVMDIELFNKEVDREKEESAHLDAIRAQAHKFFGSLALTPG